MMFMTDDALAGAKQENEKRQAPRQVMLGCLLACCLLLVAAITAVPQRAYAAAPAVGSTFTVNVSQVFDSNGKANEGTGTITFEVTSVSKGTSSSSMGEVTVTDGTQYVAKSSSSVLDLTKVVSSGYGYRITCVDRYAFSGNLNLYNVKLGCSLTGASTNDPLDNVQRYEYQAAIGSNAFSNCTNLQTATFSGTEIYGIGDFAFANCTGLTTVTFSENLVIRNKPIYNRAFLNCSSLTNFTVPAILCSARDYTARSGYQTYWHSQESFSIASYGIGAYVFDGCNALESITFRAGCTYGLFAYWESAGCGLRYLPNLKSIIFEDVQPYFGSADGSLVNQQPVTVWGDGTDADTGEALTGADPTFYYSVDYYCTSSLASADKDLSDTHDSAEVYRSNRLARVEYAQGTSVSDIQSANTDALAAFMADSDSYAQISSDGIVPNANEAAKAAQDAYNQDAYDQAQADYNQAQANYDKAQVAYDKAQAAYDEAQEAYDAAVAKRDTYKANTSNWRTYNKKVTTCYQTLKTCSEALDACEAARAPYVAEMDYAQAVMEACDTFKDADQYEWVWYLDNTQSRRTGLADSCCAYLIHADSLEAGRLESDPLGSNQIEAMYRVAGQNLGIDATKESTYIQNTAFDVERYYSDSDYRFDQSLTDEQRQQGETGLVNMTNPLNTTATMTPWFTLDSGGLLTLPDQMTLYDGAGNQLDLADESKFVITYQRYEDGEYVEVDALDSEVPSGPLLMTITPQEGSGYDTSTCLKEWILVNGHTGTVLERYTTSSARTYLNAIYANGDGKQPRSVFSNTAGNYAVCVSSEDDASTLLGASYAGLSDGPINVISDSSDYGFSLALGNDTSSASAFYTNGIVNDTSKLQEFARGDDSASEQANSCYIGFARNQESMGLSGCEWSDTALLVNPTYLEESATAAASFAYTQGAAIFYTEEDGSLSAETLNVLKSFSKTIAIGDAAMISEDVLTQVKALSSDMEVSRIQGEAQGDSTEAAPGNACSLSLAMAEYLLSDSAFGVNCSSVAIVVAESSDVVNDAVSCQNFSGHEDGITLVVSSSADAKVVAQFLREHRQDVLNIRLFGRSGAAANTSSFTFYSKLDSGDTGALVYTWEEDAEEISAVGEGDTVELYGVLFDLGADNTLSNAVRRWGTTEVPAGSYVARDTQGSAITYTLSEAVPDLSTKIAVPTAKTGLVYTGGVQTGVPSGTGYTVTDGVGKDAGKYFATVTLEYGYSWSDGSKDELGIDWTIEPAAQTGINVVLSSTSATYSGSSVTPTVTSVTLADGTKVTSNNYTVAYYVGSQSTSTPTSFIMSSGTYTVAVTLKGNYTGTALVDFVVKSSTYSGGGSSDDDEDSDSGSGAVVNSTNSGNSGSGSGSNGSSLTSGTTTTGNATVDSDGWKHFEAPGNPEGYDFNASTVSSVSLGSSIAPLDLLLLVICCLAVAGAITYATKFRKETDDQLVEVPA